MPKEYTEMQGWNPVKMVGSGHSNRTKPTSNMQIEPFHLPRSDRTQSRQEMTADHCGHLKCLLLNVRATFPCFVVVHSRKRMKPQNQPADSVVDIFGFVLVIGVKLQF